MEDALVTFRVTPSPDPLTERRHGLNAVTSPPLCSSPPLDDQLCGLRFPPSYFRYPRYSFSLTEKSIFNYFPSLRYLDPPVARDSAKDPVHLKRCGKLLFNAI